MKVDEQVWSMVQQQLGYSDQEMSQFRANPRNEEILARAPELMNKTIVAEVVHSHGCNSQHKVGDKHQNRISLHRRKGATVDAK